MEDGLILKAPITDVADKIFLKEHHGSAGWFNPLNAEFLKGDLTLSYLPY